MLPSITERTIVTERHTTFCFEAGPEDGTPIIFVHGWPELAITWRRQLAAFAALGFRAIAPDMRGYGRSRCHDRVEDYAMEACVTDLMELLAGLGLEKAVWVGHDWGAGVVWALASHHPEACLGVVNLCVPYLPRGFTLGNLVPLVDRSLYPEDLYPFGQWAYWNYHVEHPNAVSKALGADVAGAIRLIYRKGDPEAFGKVSPSALIHAPEGWTPLLALADKVQVDRDILDETAHRAYVSAFQRHGFAGGDNYYRNNEINEAYALQAKNDGRLEMPVLFVHAKYDLTCATVGTRLADPMRHACARLTEHVIEAGHRVQQEKPAEFNAALARWIATQVPEAWPG